MPEYRLNGVYHFPARRGHPKGDKRAFSEEFEATDDDMARAIVRAIHATHVPIKDAKLVRIVAREKTARVNLTKPSRRQ